MSGSLQEFADRCGPDATGTIYLLHFDQPLAHARHYMGFTFDLERRLDEHARGNGNARIMEVLAERGITFTLARTWEGPQRLERRLKRQKNAPRFCPLCNGGDP